MTDRELMRQALEALNSHPARHLTEFIVKTRNALRERLAQPEQEPVAWKDRTYGNLHHQNFGNAIPLYTYPPASKPWVGLTDEEIIRCIVHHRFEYDPPYVEKNGTKWLAEYVIQPGPTYRNIEAKLKEKNT